MKHNLSFLSIVCFLACLSCTSASNKASEENAADSGQAVIADTIQPPQNTADKPSRDDTVLNVSFATGNKQTVTGRLGMRGPVIYCRFSVSKPQSLTATIIPDKADCNIRISQIIMPGGKADGPFGREIKYKLPRKGAYQLIIDHNMMAGDPEICDFKIIVSID
jgi:hypothetical protein